jgi:hypothetical protein
LCSARGARRSASLAPKAKPAGAAGSTRKHTAVGGFASAGGGGGGGGGGGAAGGGLEQQEAQGYGTAVFESDRPLPLAGWHRWLATHCVPAAGGLRRAKGTVALQVGLGRIVALDHRSSTLGQIHWYDRYLFF